jgi:hypothetical protein
MLLLNLLRERATTTRRSYPQPVAAWQGVPRSDTQQLHTPLGRVS